MYIGDRIGMCGRDVRKLEIGGCGGILVGFGAEISLPPTEYFHPVSNNTTLVIYYGNPSAGAPGQP